jgi:hypothetical protein
MLIQFCQFADPAAGSGKLQTEPIRRPGPPLRRERFKPNWTGGLQRQPRFKPNSACVRLEVSQSMVLKCQRIERKRGSWENGGRVGAGCHPPRSGGESRPLSGAQGGGCGPHEKENPRTSPDEGTPGIRDTRPCRSVPFAAPCGGHYLRPGLPPASAPGRIPGKRGEALARGRPRIRLPVESLPILRLSINNALLTAPPVAATRDVSLAWVTPPPAGVEAPGPVLPATSPRWRHSTRRPLGGVLQRHPCDASHPGLSPPAIRAASFQGPLVHLYCTLHAAPGNP